MHQPGKGRENRRGYIQNKFAVLVFVIVAAAAAPTTPFIEKIKVDRAKIRRQFEKRKKFIYNKCVCSPCMLCAALDLC